ncbi:MAG: hypothetical protein P4L33_02800 [Capsulimonadaceae bacterium]|nr:hypothetical protein [Capsulimonadaceae bacterium]
MSSDSSNCKPCATWALVTLSAAITLGIFLLLSRASIAGLFVPYEYQYDALFYDALIKGMAEHGWILRNASLGAPAGQMLFDFPSLDLASLAILKLLTLVSNNCAVIVNVAFILSFPLTAATAAYAARRLNLAPATSVAIGILYAFAPYHFMRCEHHILLSLYMIVPLSALLIVDVAADRIGPLLARRCAGYAALAVLTGLAGAYYCLIACVLLVAVAALSALDRRRISIFTTAMAFAAIAACTLGLCAAPNIAYWSSHGQPRRLTRHADESEKFGLTLSQMILPVPHHRVAAFDDIRRKFDSNMLPGITTENDDAALGLTATIGLLVLLGAPFIRPLRKMLGPNIVLSYTVIAAYLWATIGGFAAAMTLLPMATMLRSTNRVSIFIAFCCLCAVGLAVEAVVRRRPALRARPAVLAIVGAVVVFLAVLDQWPGTFTLTDRANATRWASDERLGKLIDATLPPGAMVYNLPSVAFPEGVTYGLGDYDEFRPYLHTHHVRYSYGTIRGAASSDWQGELPTDGRDLVDTLARLGFRAIVVDASYLANGSWTAAQTHALVQACHATPTISADGDFVFMPINARPAATWGF